MPEYRGLACSVCKVGTHIMCPDNGPKLDSFWAAEAKATGKRSMLSLPRRDASEPAFHPIVVFVLLGESFGYGGRGVRLLLI
jgi:hypothetical protein